MQRFQIVLIAGDPDQPLAGGQVHDLYFGFVPALNRTGMRWLAEGEAAELGLAVSAAHEAETLAEVIADQLDRLPVDVALVAEADRRKKLLVADMDSTIIGQECIDELAAVAGLREAIERITERAMRGEIDFESALAERVRLLAGLDQSAIDTVLRDRITLNPGARTLVATMRASGARTLLISGGFTRFTEPVAGLAGFDEQHANTLDIDSDGKLTGRVLPPILGKDGKLAVLRSAVRRLGITMAEAIAVGDGANDLAMIRAAGLGVGFRAKPVVVAQAPVTVRHGDLTALLYLQGYARGDFAA